jgi:hypothetical protein
MIPALRNQGVTCMKKRQFLGSAATATLAGWSATLAAPAHAASASGPSC